MMSFCGRAQWELLLLPRNMKVEVLPFPLGWVASNCILSGEGDSKLCLLVLFLKVKAATPVQTCGHFDPNKCFVLGFLFSLVHFWCAGGLWY